MARFLPLIASLLTTALCAEARVQRTRLNSTRTSDACNETFQPISASAWVEAVNPGWNVGNTLDAIPDEGSWNNPPITGEVLDYVKEAGFKSVRIPVTYAYHYTGSSPDWTINATWLARVSEVIDMATSRGLYVITNMHHDSWVWADTTAAGANISMIQEKFYASWLQIGQASACKPSVVAFEPLNEPLGSDAQAGGNLTILNNLFLKALSDSGGFNAQRVVTLSPPSMSIATIPYFTRPTNITNPWIFQYHYYSPYDFDFSAWGKTVWGSDADKQAVYTDLASVRGNFTDVPSLMGEFSASQTNCEAAARWKWFDQVVRTARSFGSASMLWDNGEDNLDRSAGMWRDAVAVDITVHAIKGENNSLADSTTDTSATTQESSAYIFNQVGQEVTDRVVPFVLNGNTIQSLSSGSFPLFPWTDYTISGGNITFKASYLSNFISANASAGTKAKIAVAFSSGAPSQIEIVQWDVPTLRAGSSAASAVANGSDLSIPIVWKGLHKLAAVKVAASDGTFLFDSWTDKLPTLQQGRSTYSNQWSFGHDYVNITSAAVKAVIAAGKNTTFTFEFYPRALENGNHANYTLTV